MDEVMNPFITLKPQKTGDIVINNMKTEFKRKQNLNFTHNVAINTIVYNKLY